MTVRCRSRWILEADPEAGLEMFVQVKPPVPPAVVLPILSARAPALCAPFLESALAAGTASPADHANDLARLYLRAALRDSDAMPPAVAPGGD